MRKELIVLVLLSTGVFFTGTSEASKKSSKKDDYHYGVGIGHDGFYFHVNTHHPKYYPRYKKRYHYPEGRYHRRHHRRAYRKYKRVRRHHRRHHRIDYYEEPVYHNGHYHYYDYDYDCER